MSIKVSKCSLIQKGEPYMLEKGNSSLRSLKEIVLVRLNHISTPQS